MAATLNILAEEISLSTANTVNSATLVRLFNTDDTTDTLITRKDSGGTTIASVTLGAGEILNLQKDATDTFESAESVVVKAVKVGYSV
jgi:hypothetical protein